MITVSATAVGVPFDIEMPKLTDTMPNGIIWVVIVIVIVLYSLLMYCSELVALGLSVCLDHFCNCLILMSSRMFSLIAVIQHT